MKKKKILINSDFSKLKTGFGRNAKTVLQYLWDTGKYDIVEYACGPYEFNDPALKSVPWKAYGAVPPDKFLKQELDENEALKAAVNYGSYYIDEIIEKERPDCYLGINDFWAFRDFYDKPWWNKINSALWVTLDSLPLYEDVVVNGHKVKNFWVWSKFAENELKRLGFSQAQTLHGAFDVSEFKKLDNREELRAKAGIAPDEFIVGFVFRNQVRKLIGTLLEGFAMFKKTNPDAKVKLLIHTSWTEGWDIKRFLKEFKIDEKDVLTSHVCGACKNYTIKPYEGERQPCDKCGCKDSLMTPKSYFGVEEKDMNEIYNLMDFYVHPVTSGGLEMPNVEALLAGVPIATCNYSCGEEFCEQDFVHTVDHSIYREFGTQFKKSQPCPYSLSHTIFSAWFDKRNHPEWFAEKAAKGMAWAREQFDHNTICKRIEDWIDNSPEADHSYELRKIVHNGSYVFNETIQDDTEWAIDLINGVFGYQESAHSPTIQKMVEKIKQGMPRKEVYEKAVKNAIAHNTHKEKTSASEFFPDDDYVNNVVLIAPRDLTKNLALTEYVSDLIKSGSRVYIVGTNIDEEIYSQLGKIKIIPSTDRSWNPEWLKSLKNQKGVKRFKRVIWESNNNLISFDNETK